MSLLGRRGAAVLPVALVAVLAAGCTGADPPGAAPPTTSPATRAAVAATAQPSPTPSRPAGFTLVATGDVLLHEELWKQARADARDTGRAPMDFAPMLAPIAPVVSAADLAVCHLETPLADEDGPFEGYPDFSGPPQVVAGLKATGYDACSTASNHTFDQGAKGVERSLDALDEAGLAHAGSARSQAESGRTTLVEANGVKVALLSYTYGFNGKPYPGGDRWRANVIDEDRILADARTARRRGAQVVVLALHWGTEYSQKPSAQQLDLAPDLAESADVDLILSHHAHVVEPIEKVGRTWVVYGLGNLMAWHATPGPANAEGLLVRFTFTPAQAGRFTVTRAEYLPLLVARDAPVRVLDVPAALADKEYGSSSRSRLQTALDRTTRVVRSRGGAADGLVPLG